MTKSHSINSGNPSSEKCTVKDIHRATHTYFGAEEKNSIVFGGLRSVSSQLKRVLERLSISSSTCCNWPDRYSEGGIDGLKGQKQVSKTVNLMQLRIILYWMFQTHLMLRQYSNV